ncbi:hypothetical protein J437_LFUL008208 [Ladona fulva]|uniref:Mannosyltransferase n=1 Tax=Ladona fulva TaxID=123851 RepID=A0A8K0K5I5_LADFU|nr:hypothetical protein J437_LFUL008208 [Ladona fulva]
MGKGKMFLLFLCLKLLSVFVVRSAFVPDEYWQSLEVAHHLAFGYGHLTWDWSEGLRSYIYPSIIAGFFKVAEFLHLDSRDVLILIPRILQALLSAIGDYCFWLWVREQTGTKGNWAAIVISTSWFWFYCSSRTLINTVETVLTIFALYHYPWSGKEAVDGKTRFLWPVGIACIMRPTTFIIWLPFCMYHLARVNSKISVILKSYLPISILCILACVSIDSYFYGKLIFTPWNFVKFNVFHGVGAFYGTQPWYFYLFCGLPVVLGIYIVPFLYGAWVVKKNKGPAIESVLLFDIAWTIFFFSLMSHKEFRFLLPLVPMALYICCRRMSQWSRQPSSKVLWLIGLTVTIANAVPALYFGLYHQRGTLDVMEFVAQEASKNQTHTNVLFLMPCHSTPYYSHLHVNIPMRFLHCEPDFSAKPGYLDEADLFYLGPLTWLNKQYPPNSVFPSHIVMYDVLLPHLQGFLNANGYSLAAKFFHAHRFEGKVGGNVLVHSRTT